MPWWPFRRKSEWIGVSSTFELETRANEAFNAKNWERAERLYQEVTVKADGEGRQVARNMLGTIYEHLKRLEDAVSQYEANVAELSAFPHPYIRLCIIYRREERRADEDRILQIARLRFTGLQHEWFEDRYRKLHK